MPRSTKGRQKPTSRTPPTHVPRKKKGSPPSAPASVGVKPPPTGGFHYGDPPPSRIPRSSGGGPYGSHHPAAAKKPTPESSSGRARSRETCPGAGPRRTDGDICHKAYWSRHGGGPGKHDISADRKTKRTRPNTGGPGGAGKGHS